MKKEFNIGDRVAVKGVISGKSFHGEKGTVIYAKHNLLVEFDKNIGGHSGQGVIEGVSGKSGHCWWFTNDEVELIKEAPDKLIFKGNETILIKDGKEYVSKCQDGDAYDKEKGLLLCLAKANGVNYADLQKMIDGAEDKNMEMAIEAVKNIGERLKVFFEAGFKALRDKAEKPEAEKTVKEVKRRAKVGEYIKIVNAGLTGGLYKNGDVKKVVRVNDFKGVYIETYAKEDGFYVGDDEYVVLKNYKPYKITLSEFWKSKKELAIHCKTEDEAKELLKAFDKAGKKWCSGKKYTDHTNWENYKNKTHYFNDGCFESTMYVKDNNVIVYEFNEVDLNN